MGLLDKLRGTTTTETSTKAPARSIVAAAMPMAGPAVRAVNRGRQYKSTDEWQREAWYYWDATGELRSPTVWVANAVSQADPYATTLDPDTGKPTGPSDNDRAQAVAAQVLGGSEQREGLLRIIALCWLVAGEVWIIIRPRPGQPDEWRALSGNKVRAKGEQWQYTDPFTGELVTLGPRDRLIRVWCPHPDDQAKADSSVRAALPILREIEKASQNIAARLDSRLASNGIMLMADEMDFNKGDFDTAGGAVMDLFMSAAEANLQNPGQASAQVPLILNAPAEHIANGGALAHIDLATDFDGQVVELRDNGRERLATAIDLSKSTAQGTQNEANHWSAWQVSEDDYKIYIKPLLNAIGGPLTEHWMRPALIAMGETPETAGREALSWDTTDIVARPDDRDTLESAYEKLLISDEYYLTENGITTDAMPSDEERTRRLLEKLVGVAPTLLADPNVAAALGLDIEVAPVAAGVDADVAPGGELEAPEAAPEPGPRALPSTQGEQPEPEPVPEGLVAAAELIVYDALTRAGGRLLTNQNRGQFKAVKRHELYMHAGYENDQISSLLEGSFVFVDRVAETWQRDAGELTKLLRDYTHYCLFRRVLHERENLKDWLR